METWGCIATGRGEGREGRGVFVCVGSQREQASLFGEGKCIERSLLA